MSRTSIGFPADPKGLSREVACFPSCLHNGNYIIHGDSPITFLDSIYDGIHIIIRHPGKQGKGDLCSGNTLLQQDSPLHGIRTLHGSRVAGAPEYNGPDIRYPVHEVSGISLSCLSPAPGWGRDGRHAVIGVHPATGGRRISGISLNASL